MVKNPEVRVAVEEGIGEKQNLGAGLPAERKEYQAADQRPKQCPGPENDREKPADQNPANVAAR